MFCARCGAPVFVLTGRRARRQRDASVVGMVGSLVMVGQSASLLVGGVIALAALGVEVRGDRTGALALGGTALVFVGLTLLFDLLGVSLLAGSFYVHMRTARAAATFARDEQARSLAMVGLLATVFLVLWLLVTLAWRVALAALVSFYPTPFGAPIGAVQAEDLRRAASIMLGLWVTAAFLLFLGATFGTRFLRRLRNLPLTFPRLLWPLETFLHFCAALSIAIVAPGLLARTRFELDLTTLRIVQTLGVIELVIVPALGMLAYLFLFREFRGLLRGPESVAGAPAPAPPTPADPPAGEA